MTLGANIHQLDVMYVRGPPWKHLRRLVTYKQNHRAKGDKTKGDLRQLRTTSSVKPGVNVHRALNIMLSALCGSPHLILTLCGGFT